MDNPLPPQKRKFLTQTGFAAMIVFMLAAFTGIMHFGSGPAAVQAESPHQEDTAYPIVSETPFSPTTVEDYPVVTDTPFGSTPFVSLTPVESPTTTLTPTSTSTLPPNVFQTENAEMGGGLVTPPPSETPGPTITAYVSPTSTATATRQPLQTLAVKKTTGSNIDWGLFWIGFSVPVLAACGVVLYLIDRRPDLFRRKR